jgi:hypothetical protein
VGNHNFCDLSAMDEFQKGLKLGSVVVESTPDVPEDFVVRERFDEVLDLPLEVFRLLGATDAGVDDLPRLDEGVFCFASEDPVDVLRFIQSFPTG